MIKAKSKCYHRTREHIRPIHLNIPVHSTPQYPPRPIVKTPLPSCIPKPNPHLKSVYQPKKFLPKPSLCPLSHLPWPQQLPQPVPPASASPASAEQLLHHLSTLNSSSPSVYHPVQLKFPQELWPAPPTLSTLEKIGAKSPCSTSTESSPMSSISTSSKSSYSNSNDTSPHSTIPTASSRKLKSKVAHYLQQGSLELISQKAPSEDTQKHLKPPSSLK